jgi:thiol-disulfide isomerase/thioredoxin
MMKTSRMLNVCLAAGLLLSLPARAEDVSQAIGTYITQHQDQTLEQVVEYANKEILPRTGVPIRFYNQDGAGSAVPLKEIAVKGGKSIDLNAPGEDACGLKNYFLSTVKKFDAKHITTIVDGKETVVPMPDTFAVGKLSTELKGKKVATFPVTGVTLPYQVDPSGRAAFYPLWLKTPQSPPEIDSWWKKVNADNPRLQSNAAHLIFSVGTDGIRITSDRSVYEVEPRGSLQADRQKNGAFTARWQRTNGLTVTLANVCAPDLKANILTLPKFDAAKFGAAKDEGKPVMLVFTKSSCPTCHMQIPALEAVLKQDSFKDLTVFQVNFVEQSEIDSQFKVTNQNTLILYKGGKEIARSTGMIKRGVLSDFIHQAM